MVEESEKQDDLGLKKPLFSSLGSADSELIVKSGGCYEKYSMIGLYTNRWQMYSTPHSKSCIHG
jgi:hypothetical protein